ncbi:Lipase maturation factor 2 [Acropora cervicornis]|uniref:Lipase maturation factor n=1 Tax=Acropora cervicornis TaxID=6130 RepID=A0AAD9QXE2_ACRCE|nr:Lipase maturation factor 2 [Acropora cervicornis]
MAAVTNRGASQQVVRQGFLWCMAAIYLFAFTSLYVQIPGLYGHDGILPASYILHDLSTCTDKIPLCTKWAVAGECSRNYGWMVENCMKSCNSCHILDTSFSSLFRKTPTLLWVTPYLGLDTVTGMEFLCVIGISTSLVLLLSQRCRDCLSYLTLWFLYYSMLPVGQIFIRYQWDTLLLEAGFLAFLVAPWNIVGVPWQICNKFSFVKLRRLRNISRHHDSIMLWLTKWLLFRLMFASGVVKLTYMDKTWWDLSALNWHYESQCIPTPIAWYFQKLPTWFHRLSVVMTYVIEIAVPFLAFAPVRILRVFVYCSEVFLQLVILLTGNYNFFNLLTIVLCVSLLDDKFILSRVQCLRCRQCVWSCWKKVHQRAEGKSTKSRQSKDSSEEVELLEKGEAVEENINDEKAVSRSDKASCQPKKINPAEKTSTASQLMEHVLDWMNARRENPKFTQAKEFLHGEIFGRIKLVCITLSCFVALVTLTSCSVNWFNIKATKKEPVHCEIAFTPEQLVYAVQLATQFAIWMVALLMFSISLYSLTAVDRVVQRSLPKVIVNLYSKTSYLELTNAYGLFRSMTGVGGRPELLVIGSNSQQGAWEQYNFLYKPGNIYQPPPFVAPHQPRLDWQMWFAALQSYKENPWFLSFLHKLFLGKEDVLQLIGESPFQQSPPKFIRVQLFMYHYTQNASSFWQVLLHSSTEKAWWTREFSKEYLPFLIRNSSLSTLEAILEGYGVYRPTFAPEVTWGFLHPLILDLRKAHRHLAPTTLINALLSIVVVCLIFKAWWRKSGKKFWPYLIRAFQCISPALNRVCNKEEASEKTTGAKDQPVKENQSINERSTSEKQGVWNAFVAIFCATYMTTSKKVGRWSALLAGKVQEIVQRCKTVWKNRMPSVKKKA